ncbi:MAG: RsmF rRNA methyltransferase first C-terminal domain-containing protein [bacterium]|nr:RsmF rRNA methyltransferase first C-terminal domain-containing protein [bacterium]MCM1375407.1 RsmF rRNA methyltransferase first C-terminal domain-containing protein [Muribaculum sp.]
MLPEVFQQRMRSQLGAEYAEYVRSLEGERHRALRVNPLKGSGDPTEARERFLRLSPWELEPVPWEAAGFYYTQEGPGRHPYHEAGVYYIQEPSAMAPVAFLEPQPGERVLDLCAAPGGKSTQIAGRMRGEGLLVSNEIHPQRARILSENVERLGICNCLVLNEAPERLAELFAGYFDRVLVDAPCSGEGMFRKNENAGEEWSPENVERCAARQDGILDCAVAMLRPGGRLVYSTCTFAPAEDEGSVSRLIGRHPEMELLEPADCLGAAGDSLATWGFTSGRPDWIEAPVCGIDRTLRLWPHRLRGEGHYLAALQKSGASSGAVHALHGIERGIPEKECREYLEFAAEALTEKPEGIYLRFADHLYLAPRDMPSLKGLHVLRSGLHLGTVKKHRFEPAHALALALSPGEVRRHCPVSVGGLQGDASARADAYLSGQTFSHTGEGGWHLITVDGYSLGWGKLAGGVMKNHYPKGLRKL